MHVECVCMSNAKTLRDIFGLAPLGSSDLRRLQYIDLLFSAKFHPVESSKGLVLIFA